MCVCVCVCDDWHSLFTLPPHYDIQFGQTALMFATKEGHTNIAESLIHGGADMNIQDIVSVYGCYLSVLLIQRTSLHFLCLL